MAIDWAWRNAQPESPKDRVRLIAMDGLLSFQRIFHHEGIRWTHRHLKRLLPWLAKEDRYEALALFFTQSSGTIRSHVEGGESGIWRTARKAEQGESHFHKDESEKEHCPQCYWLKAVRPGSEGIAGFTFPRKGGQHLAFRRTPWTQEGNRRYSMFSALGSSAGPGGRWRVSIHRQEIADDGEISVSMSEEDSWDEFPVPELKSYAKGWTELFRVMNPDLTRVYTFFEPTLAIPVRHVFPPTPDKKLEEKLLAAWSKEEQDSSVNP